MALECLKSKKRGVLNNKHVTWLKTCHSRDDRLRNTHEAAAPSPRVANYKICSVEAIFSSISYSVQNDTFSFSARPGRHHPSFLALSSLSNNSTSILNIVRSRGCPPSLSPVVQVIMLFKLKVDWPTLFDPALLLLLLLLLLLPPPPPM